MVNGNRQIWPTVRLWACNTFIVFFVAMMFLDALPFAPQKLGDLVDPVQRVVGINQGSWGMFAPETDTDNFRLSAEIEYRDGTVATWSTPEWRKQSYWESFLGVREHEYLENVTELHRRAYWDQFADYIVKRHPGPRPDSDVKLVKIWKQFAEIPDLRVPVETDDEGNPLPVKWQSWVEPPEFEERSPLYGRRYY